MGERSGRGRAGGVGDASEGGEHPAGEKPPSEETEHQQEHPQDGRGRSEVVHETATAGRYEDGRAVDEDVSRLGTYRRRNTHTAPSSKPPAIMRKPA